MIGERIILRLPGDTRGRVTLTKRRAWLLVTLCGVLTAGVLAFIVDSVTIKGDIRYWPIMALAIGVVFFVWLNSILKIRKS